MLSCTQCAAYVRARKQLSIHEAPNILTIVLKRYQFSDLKACGIGGHDCFQTMGVLRISLGCFIFFFIMFVTTCSTSKLHETRNIWHSRWWPLKFIMLVVSLIIPFFVHSDFIQLYGELARVGAGCFLGLFTSTVFYIASVCGIGVMYSHYVPRPSCTLNIFFISWTAILLLVMMVISLHSKVSVCQELGFLRFVRSPPLHLGLPPLGVVDSGESKTDTS